MSANALTSPSPAAPARPDLAGQTVLHYPLIEREQFASVEEMCRQLEWPLDAVQGYIEKARVECSDLVVIDAWSLDEPVLMILPVLRLQPGGAVMLCCGFFAQLTEDRSEAVAMAVEFATCAKFRGKAVFVGEFRASSGRAAS